MKRKKSRSKAGIAAGVETIAGNVGSWCPPSLSKESRTWFLTGAAGFIGSNLLEWLLAHGQRVVGLDNFSTGRRENLEEVRALVGARAWKNLSFVEGDVRDGALCQRLCVGVDFVLHQAALGSVPRSLADPWRSHDSNVNGALQVFLAARAAGVKRVVYASSSSVYGDSAQLPKREELIGEALSPYAVTKRVTELYGFIFRRSYGLSTVGLRYFNVFGPRQDPAGQYAAVMPKWISALVRGEPVVIHGDGRTSRDFCYVGNVVQANIRAALAELPAKAPAVYNIANGERTSLNELFQMLRERLAVRVPSVAPARPVHAAFRAGDVRHSLADVKGARRWLGYKPTHGVSNGLDDALEWYLKRMVPGVAGV